jgi:uncharacterized protein (DUF2267 family)
VSAIVPKRPTDSRPTFPADLRDDLLRVARERGRPETEISPLLEALAREWIEKGSFQRREEELQEISTRLDDVENQLHALTRIIGNRSPASAPTVEQTTKVSTATIDNLTQRVLHHLMEIADESGVTTRVTAQQIAAAVALKGDETSGKKITERVKKLIAKGLLSIEEDSGGGGGRRYRVDPSACSPRTPGAR